MKKYLRKLHEKYSQKTSMPPELQLLVTLIGSGFMFHLTNSLFKSALPGLGDVLKTNPDIMGNIMGAMGKAMNNANGIVPGSNIPMPQQQVQQQQVQQQQQQQVQQQQVHKYSNNKYNNNNKYKCQISQGHPLI